MRKLIQNSRRMTVRQAPLLCAVAAAGLVATQAMSARASVLVAGSPGYDSATDTGLKEGYTSWAPGWVVNNSGTAVGYSWKYVSGSHLGDRAVRWDASGTAATELGVLGTNSSGSASAIAHSVNDAGTAVGSSSKYVSGSYVGDRAVRWNASETAATELDSLGTDSNGTTTARAYALNNAGTAVGYSEKYNASNVSLGSRAVRWDASGTAATELGVLGTTSSGFTTSRAYAINEAGTAVGYANKSVSGSFRGVRAVRWDASGTAATELGNLGLSSTGFTSAYAYAVNDAGTAVGIADKYVSGTKVGIRAVRWDASGTAATELGNLGLRSTGDTTAYAYAVNDAGTAVGWSAKYVAGSDVGARAVRWDASGTAATELGNLGTDSGGYTSSQAYAVNGAGTAVGYADKYVSGSRVGSRAVVWLPDASALDLNDLGVVANPNDGTWVLTQAKALSEDGWVAGIGTFDPTGVGAAYSRNWVAQIGLGGNWLNTTGSNNTWGTGKNWSTGTPAIQLDARFTANATYHRAL